MPSGLSGLIVGLAIFPSLWFACYLPLDPGPFDLDPKGRPGAFEPFLSKYLRLGEFIVGLATGSIVLLIGSANLHGQGGGVLPSFYASPLVLLGWCVLYGVGFMTWLLYHYEMHRHGEAHTRKKYALSLSLGFSSLACFVVGYGWLIFRVA